MTADLQSRYCHRLLRLADELHTLLGQPSAAFLSTIRETGAIATSKRLIHSEAPSSTFHDLSERQRLDLTVEAVVVTEREWDPLFRHRDRDAAETRLRDHGWPYAETF